MQIFAIVLYLSCSFSFAYDCSTLYAFVGGSYRLQRTISKIDKFVALAASEPIWRTFVDRIAHANPGRFSLAQRVDGVAIVGSADLQGGGLSVRISLIRSSNNRLTYRSQGVDRTFAKLVGALFSGVSRYNDTHPLNIEEVTIDAVEVFNNDLLLLLKDLGFKRVEGDSPGNGDFRLVLRVEPR